MEYLFLLIKLVKSSLFRGMCFYKIHKASFLAFVAQWLISALFHGLVIHAVNSYHICRHLGRISSQIFVT